MLVARTALLAALALVVLAPPAGGAASSPDFADPFVARDGGTYYAFATGARGKHVQVARSVDLTRWHALADALPHVASWAARDAALTWAPSVLKRKSGWVLYYSTADLRSGFQCISRASSVRPEGPYADDSTCPLVCQSELCGSIDPSPFVDASGQAWLLWKSDENAAACHAPSRIWSERLTGDGLALEGAPTALLAADRAWEQPLIEGPSMIRNGEETLLFYSAGWYEGPGYAIGWAKCAGPAGPCTKMTLDAPLVRSAGGLLGPGGQEFFSDPAGQAWMAFHAWTAPHASYATGGARSLRLARVAIVGGRPIVAP